MKKSKSMKKIQNFCSLPISLRVTLKLSLRSRFSAKKYFFVFCQKFCFNFEKLTNHYSQLKKHLKVDSETRSYDFLTRTHEKIPTIPNMPEVQTTLENRMNIKQKLNAKIHITYTNISIEITPLSRGGVLLSFFSNFKKPSYLGGGFIYGGVFIT